MHCRRHHICFSFFFGFLLCLCAFSLFKAMLVLYFSARSSLFCCLLFGQFVESSRVNYARYVRGPVWRSGAATAVAAAAVNKFPRLSARTPKHTHPYSNMCTEGVVAKTMNNFVAVAVIDVV